ncbi:Nramp family divalent metal transporter [Geomicrobium sp. JCM 19039]|uniref:Nramp family divalent metal transporter n=1 Tax=Geomicrobium sp. JCM 19039 TaxID=1460636 RepID=UPI00045F1B72|nr:Nramp family divalent metal transporter [Geomicrobium sp. JCM 19039]GAK12092.1 manganese transport protein MntH [Geomicrobium sp. JCM 19039]
MELETRQQSMKDRIVSKLKVIGPGAIITASFIGPGTVTTATRAGASFGFTLLWTVLFSIVATMFLQEMAARLGIVSKKGLGEALHDQFKRPFLKYGTIGLVSISIGVGCAAYMAGDLTGGALGVSMLTGVDSNVIAPILGVIILLIGLFGSYKIVEKLLIVLVAVMSVTFITTMIVVDTPLGELFQGAFIPTVPSGSIIIVVALIGTTVVPYNLFLHASSVQERWRDARDLKAARLDIILSIGLGGVITAAILITAGAVIRGVEVESVNELGMALEPLLGPWAVVFISIGMLAAGFSSAVAAPIGAAYTISGVMKWGSGFDKKAFKVVFGIVIGIGIITSATGFEPLSILLFAQALNGIILPVIAIFLLIVLNNKKLLGQYVNSVKLNIIGGLIVLICTGLGVYSLVTALMDFIG